MSNESLFEKPVGSVFSPSDELDDTLILRQKQERITKDTKLIFRILSTVAIGSLATATVAVNMGSIKDGFRIATVSEEPDESVSRTASYLTGSPIYVICDSDPLSEMDSTHPLYEDGIGYSRAGMVRKIKIPFGLSFFPPITTLREDVCVSIADFSPLLAEATPNSFFYPKFSPQTLDYAANIDILLHEIEHTNEVSSEAEASCYAIQKLPGALEASGIDTERAEQLSFEVAKTESQFSMSEYKSDECKPGGAYDLHIGNSYLINPSEIEAPSYNIPIPIQP